MAHDMDPKANPIYARARLADMLAEAAELEHSLCCQYLFAAFSLKRTVDEGLGPRQVDLCRDWQTVLLDVARQEMEHLGLVINLQTAIGEAPHLDRPNFPMNPQYYETGVESKLEKFGLSCMRRFVMFELPDDELTSETKRRLNALVGQELADAEFTIGELYKGISELIMELSDEDPAKDTLFIGPKGAQFKMTDSAQPGQVFRSSEQGVGTAYSINLNGITDRASALKAVEQIVEEGEGATDEREGSHFGKFLNVLGELTKEIKHDPAFEPARPVVENPRSMVVGRGNAQKEGFLITNEGTNTVSRAFDQAYTTLMLLLARFFGGTDQQESDSLALEFAAFFPMMTMIIRPLAEVLTRLPATDDTCAGNAGPTFRFERRTALLPHRDSAFDVIATNLDMLHEAMKECRQVNLLALDLSGDEAEWLDKRIDFMIENTWRIRENFTSATGSRSLQ